MAKPKVSERQNWMEQLREEAAARKKEILSFPLLAERWYVIEQWPDTFQHDEYNGGSIRHKGRVAIVSKYFDTEAEAIKFTEDHDPDDPKGKFWIKHQYLRTHTKVWNEWGDV